MPEEEHKKESTQETLHNHADKKRVDRSQTFTSSFRLQPSIDELVVLLVIRTPHFPELALERQVLEPLVFGASELHRPVEAFFI